MSFIKYNILKELYFKIKNDGFKYRGNPKLQQSRPMSQKHRAALLF